MTQNSTVIVCFVKINHLSQQGQEKITAGVFVSFRFAVPVNMLKRESFAQTNLPYNCPSLSRDMH